MKNKISAILLSLGLIIGFLLSRSEIIRFLVADENQNVPLFSKTGVFALFLYIIFAVAGLLFLIIRVWLEKTLVGETVGHMRMWLRWLVAAGLLLFVAWIYLYSPWQFILVGAWTQFIFALLFAQLISFLLFPQSGMFCGSEIVVILSIFLFPRVVSEIRLITDSPFSSRMAFLLGYVFIVSLMMAMYHPLGSRLKTWLLQLRERIGKARWLLIVLCWLFPILYHYFVGGEIASLYSGLRFVVLLLAAWIASFLFTQESGLLVSPDSLAANFGMLIFFMAVDDYLLLVVNYPFGLYWSEGNRFYDYSLVFGQSLYNYSGTIVNPYGYIGRYGLWGVLFLWKDLPIWMHRLWNLFLQIVPPVIFSLLLTRKIQSVGLRYQMAIWIALFFIVLAPLHPPFIIASIIIALFAFDASPVKLGLSVLVAGYYVAISRFTWAFAPAAMGALIDLLLYYPQRKGNWLRRLLPTVTLAILGMAPGLYLNFTAFQTTVQGESLTGQQPLLWYRLLPNTTLGPGVFFLALMYTGPLLIFLGWWIVTKQWKLDPWQKLAIWGALFGFFAVGLVISTKIGGGGDLHNLDMYLVTLILVFVICVTELANNVEGVRLPAWGTSLIVLLILFPIYHYAPMSAIPADSEQLPNDAVVKTVLSTIQREVEIASKNGDVLFIDQRQLLTFGYVRAIPFVPEYEKKYMMDQAMANNKTYFKSYYQNLANKRFTLIVSDVLRRKLKSEMGSRFGEENDAFVTWVSNPTLCFYKPIYTSKETNIMLLVPRPDTSSCEDYLK